MNSLRFWIEGILAGVCISLGAYANVRAGGIVGAALFAFGLVAIILSQYKLFTGMIGFCKNGNDVVKAYAGLLANVVGCATVGLTLGGVNAEAQAVVDNIITARLGYNLWQVFALGIFCGMIMTIVVNFARQGKFLPLCIGIPLFIIAGFLHCVADAFYYFADANMLMENLPQVLLVWIITVAGNTVGCNIPNIPCWVGKE